jgi:LacI family transcriptional regulator
MGRRVPDDCSVVGCDGLDSAAYTNPPLTTVRVPFYEIGAEAMRLLLKMVAGGPSAAVTSVVPVQLIKRASTASVA